jgi:hypothetical protein
MARIKQKSKKKINGIFNDGVLTQIVDTNVATNMIIYHYTTP